jgi:hypothetical protein
MTPLIRLSTSNAAKPRARLNECQVVQIFRSKVDLPRKSSAELASLYHVSEKTIRDIWTGRTWSKETWHLDKSRTIQLKQPGRPKGCKDSQPRKKRVSGVQGYETVCADEHISLCPDNSNSWSEWKQSQPSHSYNTDQRKHTSAALPLASIDEQLHDWKRFWRSIPTQDPFRGDWTLEYA